MLLPPDNFLDDMLQVLQENRNEEKVSWSTRNSRLLRLLKNSIGDFARPGGDAELDAVLLERVELDGLIRERVTFTTLPGLRMPAYVIIPDNLHNGERRPAVLLWHGHGYGSRSLVGLQEDGTPIAESGNCAGNLALQLGHRGLIVMVPEIIGFGDRRLQRDLAVDAGIKNSCFNLSVALLMTGKTTAGLRVFEASRAIDYLQSRLDVDASRIGNMGHSGGGMVASLSAAIDDRIQASVVGIYANTYQGSILSRTHCLCNYIPGILSYAEMPEILGLIAPRALFIESGRSDPLFPIATTLSCICRLHETYSEAGVAAKLDYDIFDGGHEIDGGKSIDWLMHCLMDS